MEECMSRKPRLYGQSGVYHIILRGNNQQNIFCEDVDRIFLLKRLKKYADELHINIYAYCLMANHIHILAGNIDKNMGLFVQKLANSYVYYFNRKYERSGHLFQGRYKSEIIEDDIYLKTVLRYILKNPEKCNIDSFNNYKWNSFKEMLSDKPEKIIDKEYVNKLFGSPKELIDFLSIKDPKNYMEYENKIVINDLRAFKIIRMLFHIDSPFDLGRLEYQKQLEKCKILKTEGLSISQISRLTGINRGVIKSA